MYIATDLVVKLAAAFVLIVAGLVLILSVWIIYRRRRFQEKKRARQKFQSRWEVVLAKRAAGEKVRLPEVEPEFEVLLLELWYKARRTVYGRAGERLEELHAPLDLLGRASHLLTENDIRQVVVALGVLSYLEPPCLIEEFRHLMERESTIVSFTAALALARTAPGTVAEVVLKTIAEREDWPRDRSAALLDRLEGECLYQEAEKIFPELSVSERSRLLRSLPRREGERLFAFLEQVLTENEQPEVISAALGTAGRLGHPDFARFARCYISSSVDFLRVQSATALGLLGGREDAELLERSLGDPEWWVRYRSARALENLGLSTRRLEKISSNHPDRFGREILDQVLAEERYA